MTPELKSKWITALSDGRYRKARECLAAGGADPDIIQDRSYCCLGVLLCITGHEQDIISLQNDGQEDFGDAELERYGLSENNQQELISRNDDEDADDWSDVIEYIEECL